LSQGLEERKKAVLWDGLFFYGRLLNLQGYRDTADSSETLH